MFPERQLGPHRDWKQEVEYLDNIFHDGAAYTVGKVNGDHWLLYLTTPEEGGESQMAASAPCDSLGDELLPDFTIEILMSGLATEARQHFFSSLSPSDDPHDHASVLSDTLGISGIFPPHLTTLDAYSFRPCGYSANALIKWGADSSWKSPSDFQENAANRSPGSPDDFREGYYTIHVTPEEGWSYASFECNVPSHSSRSTRTVPDLKSLVQRVVAIFQPSRLTLSLFISSRGNEAEQGESIEAVQRAFKLALTEVDFDCEYSCLDPDNIQRGVDGNWKRLYKRTDKINYEFGGYELAFASFELRS
jgi:S-adenosylmethionine decarboxylase